MRNSQIQGSKPRKFITRTILTNPSLISVSVTSLLDPENQSLPKIYSAIEKRQVAVAENQSRILNDLSPAKFQRQSSLQLQRMDRQSSNRMDSLQQAERQFLSKKLTQPQLKAQPSERSPLLIKKQLSRQLSFMSRGNSTPSLFLNNFNYKSTGQIKQKQSKAYNIINNLA